MGKDMRPNGQKLNLCERKKLIHFENIKNSNLITKLWILTDLRLFWWFGDYKYKVLDVQWKKNNIMLMNVASLWKLG